MADNPVNVGLNGIVPRHDLEQGKDWMAWIPTLISGVSSTVNDCNTVKEKELFEVALGTNDKPESGRNGK